MNFIIPQNKKPIEIVSVQRDKTLGLINELPDPLKFYVDQQFNSLFTAEIPSNQGSFSIAYQAIVKEHLINYQNIMGPVQEAFTDNMVWLKLQLACECHSNPTGICPPIKALIKSLQSHGYYPICTHGPNCKTIQNTVFSGHYLLCKIN